jgi:threonine/homoserine/homoserine lactone efflux protein
MEEKDNNIQYTYDTPNNLIKKEGDFFRKMTSSATRRPLSLRIFIIIFAILVLILPGITFVILSMVTISDFYTPILSRIAGFVMGIFFTILGLNIIYKNIKKLS